MSADGVRIVAGDGNDSNSGLSRTLAMRTLAAAYAALPSTGGAIYALPGRYDVGSGFALTRGKVLALVGVVPPPVYINSASTAPLSNNCAIIYSSSNPASLITTIAGTAATRVDGLKFYNCLYELSGTATTVALDLTACSFTEIVGNYFFADKTTGPSPVTAQGFYSRGDLTYGGGTATDCSWSRVNNNRAINMALGTFGNATGTKYSNNQQIVRENVCLGLNHANTSCLPAISFYGAHRTIEWGNNLEAYNRGILMDTCWDSTTEYSGGEFVDVYVDLVNCKGIKANPLGMSWSALGDPTPYLSGGITIRGDSSTKAGMYSYPNWFSGNDQRMKPPADDATNPQVVLTSQDNVTSLALPQKVTSTQASNYTLLMVDSNKMVEGTKATAQTITVPPNSTTAFPIGTIIDITQIGAGQITLTPGAGVTIRNPGSLTTRAQYSTVSLRKRGTDEWVASGDLT